jgi:CRP/FNR family transcriptional regulator
MQKTERRCLNCPYRSPLFNLLSDEELQMMYENKITVKFNKGETIKKQGTIMTHVVSVNSGLAKLYLEGLDHKNAIIRIVKPTNFVGGSGMYLDQIHHYTLSALMDTTVCFIDINTFKEVINGNKKFFEEFMKDFSRKSLAVYDRLISLTQKQMPGRMADSLLYLYEDIFEGRRLNNHISNQDLAELSGMSKDSAVKTLRNFQNEGFISISEHEIEILNYEALQKISKTG